MKFIKQNILGFAVISLLACSLMIGCNTNQQTTAYKTLYGLETGATAAYSGYTSMVIKGQCGTNDVPAVSRAFNIFQAAVIPALDAVQYSTNALAPANLVQESSDLINLITTAENKK